MESGETVGNTKSRAVNAAGCSFAMLRPNVAQLNRKYLECIRYGAESWSTGQPAVCCQELQRK
jgi:hypothetical protein